MRNRRVRFVTFTCGLFPAFLFDTSTWTQYVLGVTRCQSHSYNVERAAHREPKEAGKVDPAVPSPGTPPRSPPRAQSIPAWDSGFFFSPAKNDTRFVRSAPLKRECRPVLIRSGPQLPGPSQQVTKGGFERSVRKLVSGFPEAPGHHACTFENHLLGHLAQESPKKRG